MGSSGALSYSGFRAYAECPLRWKFLYIDRLPEAPRGYFSFGRSIHSALEEFVAPLTRASGVPRPPPGGRQQRTLHDFRDEGAPPEEGGSKPPARAPMTVAELLEVYRRVWVSEGYFSPDDEKRYFDLGSDLLKRFHAAFVESPPRPVAVEQELDAQIDGIAIHGIVDRIDEGEKGGLEVLDYKTSKELSWKEARDSDQLTIYQLLVERTYGRPVEALTLYHMRTLSPLRTPARDEREVADLAGRLGEVADGIAEQNYDPKPGPYCQRCDFRSRCPEWREIPAEEREHLRALVERYLELKREGDGIRQEMEQVASDLHSTSERLGVTRLPGRRLTLYRRKELGWDFPSEQVLPVLTEHGLLPQVARVEEGRVAKLLHDPKVSSDAKRALRARGNRRRNISLRLEGEKGTSERGE